MYALSRKLHAVSMFLLITFCGLNAESLTNPFVDQEQPVDLLASAIVTHNITEAQKLIEQHPTIVNELSKAGMPPLFTAMLYGRLELFNLLLLHGADVTLTDISKKTALHHAAWLNQLTMAQVLLDAGINIEARDNNIGKTALHWAAEGGNLEMVQLLIARGANIHATDNTGWTALHYAAYANKPDVVKLLLKHGAQITALTNKGQTAYDLAKNYPYLDVLFRLNKAQHGCLYACYKRMFNRHKAPELIKFVFDLACNNSASLSW